MGSSPRAFQGSSWGWAAEEHQGREESLRREHRCQNRNGKTKTHKRGNAGQSGAAMRPRRQTGTRPASRERGPGGETSTRRRRGARRQSRDSPRSGAAKRGGGSRRTATTTQKSSRTRARDAPAATGQAVTRTDRVRANLASERQEDLAGPQWRGGGDEGGGWGSHAAPCRQGPAHSRRPRRGGRASTPPSPPRCQRSGSATRGDKPGVRPSVLRSAELATAPGPTWRSARHNPRAGEQDGHT